MSSLLFLLAVPCSLFPVPSHAANWYVNDTSATGDIYTTSNGADTQPGTSTEPFRCIQSAIDSAAIGDTIFIDAGTYDSYVWVTGTETAGVNITKDSITLVGKDSASTIIDPPGAKTITTMYGIYADTQVHLFIRDLAVTGANDGIHFRNVDSSVVSGDSLSSNGNAGIALIDDSDSNLVRSNLLNANTTYGFFASVNVNTIAVDNNIADGNSTGFFVGSPTGNSTGNLFQNNTASSNSDGIHISGGGSTNNSVLNNTVTASSNRGILINSANSNTVKDNTVTASTNEGIFLNSASSCQVERNVVLTNGVGVVINSASSNRVMHNRIVSSVRTGVQIGANSNQILQNDIVGGDTGVLFNNAADSNSVDKNNITGAAVNFIYNSVGNAQNLFRNWYGTADSAAIKDKISDTPSHWQPYRLALVDTTAGADTTAPDAPDTVAIIGQGASDTSIIIEWAAVTALEEANGGVVGLLGYRVYRSTVADTSSWTQVRQVLGAGGIRRYQDTDVVLGVVYYYRVTAFDGATFPNESYYSDSQVSDSAWLAGTVNIYVNDTSVSGDVYTSAVGSDVTGKGTASQPFNTLIKAMQWATAGDTIFIDAGLYDSYVWVTGTETAGVNITKDSITLVGKDSASTIIDPPGAKTITTMYGIYADTQINLFIRNLAVTGAYNGIRFVNVDVSTMTGDSASSLGSRGIYFLNGCDTNTLSNNQLDLNTQQGVEINGGSGNTIIGNTVRANGSDGVKLSNGARDNTISNNTVQNHSGPHGIHLLNADSNLVTGNTSTNNSTGIYLDISNSNTLSNNIADTNVNGVFLINGCTNNIITGNSANANTATGGFIVSGYSFNNNFTNNTANGNTQYGFDIETMDSSSMSGNTAKNNGIAGLYLLSCTDLVVTSNIVNGNLATGIYLLSTTSRVVLRNNSVKSNVQTGIVLEDAVQCVVAQNDVTFSDTGILLSGSHAGNVVTKNNITGNAVKNFFNLTDVAVTATRNWFGSTDSVAVSAKVSDTVSAWQPYRLAAVDTALTADTTAPDAPDSVAIVGNDTTVIIEWAAVSTNEETMAGGVSLAGYKVYRSTIADTSSWVQVAQVGSSVIRHQDTDVLMGTKYYYRVTAYDTASPFANESFYSDTQVSDSAMFANTVNWYVNDAWVNGTTDSFTYAGGSDTSYGLGTVARPFKTIPRAMQFATTGDTIWIDAGLYDSYVNVNSGESVGVNIDKDSITLIGKDSNATVVNPSVISATGIFSIYADTQAGLSIRNLGVTGAYIGIKFVNVDLSTISGDSASANGNAGIYLTNRSESNTIFGNLAGNNTGQGIYLEVNSTNNTITQNTINSNTTYGINMSAGYNYFLNNTVNSNGSSGIGVLNINGCLIKNNIVKSNTQAGIVISASLSNVIYQNEVSGNDTGLRFMNGSTGSKVMKNNLAGNNVNNIYNNNPTVQTNLLTRNWFGTADSDAIIAKVTDTANAWQPYRLGAVDTATGADTVAPDAPDTVAVVNNDTSIILEWAAVTANEDTTAGDTALAGYKVYRSLVADTSSWTLMGTVAAPAIRYQDTSASGVTTHYYRVTAYDTATFPNESYYSDSQASSSGPTSAIVNWYVNDTWVSGVTDSYTYAGGSDTSYGLGTVSQPFKTIPRAMQFATAGDTIYVDAGLYDSYVVVSATETAGVNITVDSLTLIGRDSGLTVIDPPGLNSVQFQYGIYADTQTGIAIKNIGVTGVAQGMYFINIDRSTITGDSVGACGEAGIYFLGGSEFNTISNNVSSWNRLPGGNGYGIVMDTSSYATISNNVLVANKLYGIIVSGVAFDTISNNTIDSTGSYGIYLFLSDTVAITGNSVTASGFSGIYVDGGSYATITGNVFDSSGRSGIELTDAAGPLPETGVISGNTIRYNKDDGISMTSHNYAVRNNMIRSNTRSGVLVGNSGNLVTQNDISGSDSGIYIVGATGANIITKNNVTSNVLKNVYNQDGIAQTLTRNWFGSEDSYTISLKISDTASAWQPYRIGTVDTTDGADTVAPNDPDTVAVVGNDTSIIVEWSAVTANEDGVSGAANVFAYALWRSKVPDTSSWNEIMTKLATRFEDTGVILGDTYYYRVTALDTMAKYENESFYSDTQVSAAALGAGRVNWYVNDTWVNGTVDSFTYSGGSDTTWGDGTAQKPFRSIPRAMRFATAGDTIFIDAGLYDSYVTVNVSETAGVNIDKDSITLVGKDSNATVIDPPGQAGLNGLYAINATNRYNLNIRNIGATGAQCGMMLTNVDLSTITGDSVSANCNHGIYLLTGSDSNTISGNYANYNDTFGIMLENSSGNTVSGNTANSNKVHGIYLLTSPGNMISGNTANSNTTDGIYMASNSNGNTLSGNTANSNSDIGIDLYLSSNNTISSNTVSSNAGYGVNLSQSSDNTLTGNTAGSNAGAGIYMEACSNNTLSGNSVQNNVRAGVVMFYGADTNAIVQNEISGSDTGIWIDTSSRNNRITRNNITANNVNNFYNQGGLVQIQSRNWWGYTDGDMITPKFSDTATSYLPHRLGQVDTTAGADTTAPYIFDTSITLSAGNTIVTITWDTPTQDEDSNTMIGFGGVTIYRLTSPDTKNWVAAQVGNVLSGLNSYVDTGRTNGVTYYYRLTATDASGIPNASWFTDTKSAVPSIDTTVANIWYVNDTSLTGDSHTTGTGSDTQNGLYANAPLRTIQRALNLATSGDTIYVDAGLYTETVVIDTNSIDIIGKDSNATVIDPPGLNTTAGLFGIYADTQTGLTVKNIGVTGAFDGINFQNVDQSVIEFDSASQTGNDGIHLLNGSDTNTIRYNAVDSNALIGIAIDASSGNTVLGNTGRSNFSAVIELSVSNANTVRGNLIVSNLYDGILVSSGRGNTIDTNTIRSNGEYGIVLSGSSNNVISGNITDTNVDGIRLNASSSENTLTSNTAFGNTSYGIYILSSCTGNTVSGGTFKSNVDGVRVATSSANNTFTGNVMQSNSTNGVFVSGSNNQIFLNNVILSNADGMYITSSSGNILENNLIRSNSEAGVVLQAATTNSIRGNDFAGNDTAIWVVGASTGNTIAKNNFTGTFNSSIMSDAAPGLTLSRNYFGTANEASIDADLDDTSEFRPYRLSVVDTTSGADTTAPLPPPGITADTSSGVSILLTWTIPATNEETNGGAVNYNGAKVYRLANSPDTTYWAAPSNLVRTAGPGDTTWADTDVTMGSTYYYRFVSFDSTTQVNYSYFSDTIKATIAVPTWAGPVWFVDKDTGADTYTGHPNYPFKTIAAALAAIPADTGEFDTVTIDRNTYTETITIDTDYIWIQGADSSAAGTVLNTGASDSTVTNKFGIYASTRSDIVVKSLRVQNGWRGINFIGVDTSRIEDVTVVWNYEGGISLITGSDYNTVTRSQFLYNGLGAGDGDGDGLEIASGSACTGNIVSYNHASGNATGIMLSDYAYGTFVDSNTASENTGTGISLDTAYNSRIVNNTVTGNGQIGVTLIGASNNVFLDNTVSENGTKGVLIDVGSNYNLFVRNVTTKNEGPGIELVNADTNTFLQNESRSDSVGIAIYGAGGQSCEGNQFVRNNIFKPDSFGVIVAGAQSISPFFWRNYIDTTNQGTTSDTLVAQTLFGLMYDVLDGAGPGLAADTQPRFAPVDTRATSDSIAPYETAGALSVVTDTGNSIVQIRWVLPQADEAGGGGATATNIRIYRTTNPSLTDWKSYAYLTQRPGTDTEYSDATVVNGIIYYYRVTAIDSATFPNECYFTDSVVCHPETGPFIDMGAMTVYVSDTGDSLAPTTANPLRAFCGIGEAMDRLDPYNGYDTIVVFSSMRSDSYGVDAVSDTDNDVDTGLTLISAKALFGTDTGGGGDTWPTVRFYITSARAAVLVYDSARIEGMKMSCGAGDLDGVAGVKVVGAGVILRLSEVREADTGVEVLGQGLRIEGCTVANVGMGVALQGNSRATIQNSMITGSVRSGIWAGNSSGNNVITGNVIRGNGSGIALQGAGSDRVMRNSIYQNEGEGIDVTANNVVIHANDIAVSDTGIQNAGTGLDARWNNITNCTSALINDFGSGSILNHNYFADADWASLASNVTPSAGAMFTKLRFAVIDTKAGGDSIAPGSPASAATDINTANQITVRWQPAPDEGGSPASVTGYRVYRLVDSVDATNWKAITPMTDTSYTDTFIIDSDITFSSTYYYRVLAYDANNNEGWFADTVSAIPLFSSAASLRFLTAAGADATTYRAVAMESIVIDVKDSDVNTNTSGADTLTVILHNETLGTDTEILSCVEVSLNAGRFMGTVPISLSVGDAAPQSGELYVRVGDTIRISYTDSPSGPALTEYAIIIPVGVSGSNANIYLDQDQFMDQAGQQLDTDFLITVYDTQFEAVYGATVTFSVSFPSGSGASLSVSSTTTDTQGQARTRLTLGNLNDVYIVTASVNGLDSYFTAYADGVDVPAGEWIMWSPMRGPSTLAQLSGATSDLSFYEWDPSVGSGSNGSFSQYRTHSGNPSPNNATYTFSDFEPGEGYWVYNGGSAASFRPTGGALQADTGYFKVLQDDVSASSPWLQFGNPFPFWIDVERDIKVETDASGCSYTMEEADSAGVLDRVVYWYDEDANNYVWGPKISPSAVTGSGSNQGTAASENRVFLKPGVGFWGRVTSNNPCTFVFIPTKRTVEPDSVVILNQAPPLLSAGYKNRETKTSEAGWEIQFVASAGARKDVMNYAGVMPTAELAMQGSRFDPPAPAAGYVSLSIFDPQSEVSDPKSSPMAASYAPRSTDPKKVFAWPVEVRTDLAGQAVTITWDNVENLPTGFGAYLKTPEGEMIDMAKKPSTSFAGGATGVTMKAYTLYVGSAEALAAVLAAPLSKENTFAYPNPGPDAATGSVTFGYNLPAATDVKIRIFDVGGRLVRELGGAGTVGANTIVWDTTNRHGQKVGSGVYIYKIEAGGEKLVDKLAIVR